MRNQRQAYPQILSTFFSPEYYLRDIVVPDDVDPIEHYVHIGAKQGRDPHPLFDTNWYLKTYPDVGAAGVNPLLHFLQHGRHEGRAPNPFFDPAWYRARYEDVAASGIDPLDHYLQWGAGEGRDPHPQFDTTWYLATYPDVAANEINALLHFLQFGRQEGRQPAPPRLEPRPAERRVSIPSDSALIAANSTARKPLLVLVTHDCSLTGAPMVILNLAEHLVERDGVHVVVFSKAGGSLLPRFEALPAFRMLEGDAPAALDAALANLPERLVRAAFCNTIVTADLITPLKRRGFTVVSLIHELPSVIEVFGRDTIETVDRAADAVVFGSAFTRREVEAAYALRNPQIHVVPTGSPPAGASSRDPDDCRARLRREAEIPADSVVVLGCGTVEHRKGIDLFVQVASKAIAVAGDADLHFVWVGAHSGQYLHLCRQDVAKLHLSERIRFLDARQDLGAYLTGADIFLLPSREDPFPLVNLLAMACGIPPVVFAAAGGASEALEDGAGVVVPFLDTDAMAAAVARLGLDAGVRRAIGERARMRYGDLYTQVAFSRNLSSILARIGLPIDLVGSRPSVADAVRRGRPSSQVSVVIPSYNHAPYLERAIRSVLDQNSPVLELIIVDDASQDGSDAIIRRIMDAYAGPVTVRYEALKQNGGAHAAIMRGLSLARGEILSILNSDDYYATDRFDRILSQVPYEGDFLAFSAVDFVDGDGRRIGPDSGIRNWYRSALRDTIECPTVGFALLRNNIAVTSGNIVFTAALYRKVGGFAQYRMCHDWDFIMRCTHHVEPIFLQVVGMAYRVHETNTLHSTRHLLEAEGTPALNTYVELVRHEPSPNRLAPSPRNWPLYFDYFVDTYPSWFSPDPMRRFIRHMPSPSPLVEQEWTFGGNGAASDLGILRRPGAAQDAIALRRAIAVSARDPAEPAGMGFPASSTLTFVVT